MAGSGRSLLASTGAALLVALAVASCGGGGSDTQTSTASVNKASPGPRPNIVVIMSDDQDVASMATAMPRTEQLARSGTTFNDFVVTTPSCCPSRAAFLTGQYGHNNGVLANIPGYPDLLNKEDVLPAWLQRAGYKTAEFGKFMNLYETTATEGGNLPAPGWDVWDPLLPPFTYYDYSLSIHGQPRHYGSADHDYLTDVLTDRAVRFLDSNRSSHQPFFAWVNLYAPHLTADTEVRGGKCTGSAVPAPRDRGRFTPANVPTPRSFGEPDVTDKPYFVRARPPISANRARRYKQAEACRLGSIVDVDRSVKRIYSTLERNGQLDNTLVVFTSDNGWLEGQHRLEGKAVPYDESVRVPLIVWAPPGLLGGQAPPKTISQPVANIDLAPTILQAASAPSCRTNNICRVVDGRSMVPLLRGHAGSWPQHEPILLESLEGDFGICGFEAVRVPGYMYAEYSPFASGSSGECGPVSARELYNLDSDPSELKNLLPAPAGSPDAKVAERLSSELARIRDCQGNGSDDPRNDVVPCP